MSSIKNFREIIDIDLESIDRILKSDDKNAALDMRDLIHRRNDFLLDSKKFLKKTYETELIKHIKEDLEKLEKPTDNYPKRNVKVIKAGFGGGKTHTLIYFYHYAISKGWRVIAYTGNQNDLTIWENFEYEITNNYSHSKDVPSKERLQDIINNITTPTIYLVDELVEEISSKSPEIAGHYASQVITFIRNLIEISESNRNLYILITLPDEDDYKSSDNVRTFIRDMEHRLKRYISTITLASDYNKYEPYRIIRKSLFGDYSQSDIDEQVKLIVDYFKKSGALDSKQYTMYLQQFQESYPFLPEVIELIHDRYSSIFQKNRHIIKFLALVLKSIHLSGKPRKYIGLGDIDLDDKEIQGFLKNIFTSNSKIVFEKTIDEMRILDKDKLLVKRAITSILLQSLPTDAFARIDNKSILRNASLYAYLEHARIEYEKQLIQAIDENLPNFLYLNKNSTTNEYVFRSFLNLEHIIRYKLNQLKSSRDFSRIKDKIVRKYLSEYIREEYNRYNKRDFEIVLETLEDANTVYNIDTPKLKFLFYYEMSYDDLMENMKNILIKRDENKDRIYKNALIFINLQNLGVTEKILEMEIMKQIEINRELDSYYDDEDQLKLAKNELKNRLNRVKEEINKSLYKVKLEVYLPYLDKNASDFKFNNRLLRAEDDTWKNIFQMLESKFTDLDIRKNRLEIDILKQMLEKMLLNNDYIEVERVYQEFMKMPGNPKLLNSKVITNTIEQNHNEFKEYRIELDNRGNEIILKNKEDIIEKQKLSSVPASNSLSNVTSDLNDRPESDMVKEISFSDLIIVKNSDDTDKIKAKIRALESYSNIIDITLEIKLNIRSKKDPDSPPIDKEVIDRIEKDLNALRKVIEEIKLGYNRNSD
ncbi:MAG: hypothetical protein QXL02_02960 [Candidatus Anstonellales archaeon]